MKVVLIGADGQLGSDLMRVFEKEDLMPLYYPDFDLIRSQDAERQIHSLHPDVVINTAAFNKVDESESNLQAAFDLNCYAVRNLARWCRESKAVLVHFSTDYVFDGKKSSPYTELDCPNPLNVYGVSKLCGEHFILGTDENNILIRTCGLYGRAGCWGKGYNFVDTMIGLAQKRKKIKVVNDQWVTPTHTRELAEKVKEVIASQGKGRFHLTNEGACTWFIFAQEIFSLTGQNPEMEAVDSAAFGSPAIRPAYSVLENRKAAELKIPAMSHWKDALREYLIIKQYI
jgi:dTDP-4-dehydrorhamnose reductase